MTIKIPKPEDLLPSLVLAQNDAIELNAKKAEKLAEAAATRLRLNTNEPSAGNVAKNALKQILGKKTDADVLPDDKRLAKVLAELELLNQAEGFVQATVRNERAAASRLVCEHVQPEHSRLAKQFAAKLLELHKAHIEYAAFCDAVENTGAQTSALGIVQPLAFHPRDPSGGYCYGFKELREAGFIERSQIPECVR